MITAASPFLDKLEKLDANVENEAYRIIAEVQDLILEFVQDKQLLNKGIDGKGEFLGYYSPYTIALKKLKGEVYTHTTLLDEGDLYEGMYITARDGKYFIDSSDSKTEMLKDKYGESIMILTDENNRIVNDKEILPRLSQWMIQNLFDFM